MIVVPDKLVDDAGACGTRGRLIDREAFVVDGLNEALDFAVAFGRVRAQPAMTNAETPTGVLEAGSALSVVTQSAS